MFTSSQKTSSRNLRDTRKEFLIAFVQSDAVSQVALSHYIDASTDALTLPNIQDKRSQEIDDFLNLCPLADNYNGKAEITIDGCLALLTDFMTASAPSARLH